MSNFLYEYIRTFIRVNFLIRIYSDIHSCRNSYECHTLVCNPFIPPPFRLAELLAKEEPGEEFRNLLQSLDPAEVRENPC